MNVTEIERLQDAAKIVPHDVWCEMLDCMKVFYTRFKTEATHADIPLDVEEILLEYNMKEFGVAYLQRTAANPSVPFNELKWRDIHGAIMGMETTFDAPVFRVGTPGRMRECRLRTLELLQEHRNLRTRGSQQVP